MQWILVPTMVRVRNNGYSPCLPETMFPVLGDTAFNLAEATQGGRVVAFEMGPPIQFLHFNKK